MAHLVSVSPEPSMVPPPSRPATPAVACSLFGLDRGWRVLVVATRPQPEHSTPPTSDIATAQRFGMSARACLMSRGKELSMDVELTTSVDGQRTQVGADPLDYVLRHAAGDYDCYHNGRYIGSRATLPKAIAARAYGQLALDLRALPRGATIRATLDDAPPDCLEMIAFTVVRSCAGIPTG